MSPPDRNGLPCAVLASPLSLLLAGDAALRRPPSPARRRARSPRAAPGRLRPLACRARRLARGGERAGPDRAGFRAATPARATRSSTARSRCWRAARPAAARRTCAPPPSRTGTGALPLQDRIRRSGAAPPTSVDGEAEREGRREIEVAPARPKRDSFAIGGDTLFPSAHMKRLIEAARAGETTVGVKVFDGSDDGRKVYDTLAVIGRRIEPGAERGGAGLRARGAAPSGALAGDAELFRPWRRRADADLRDLLRDVRERGQPGAHPRLRRVRPEGRGAVDRDAAAQAPVSAEAAQGRPRRTASGAEALARAGRSPPRASASRATPVSARSPRSASAPSQRSDAPMPIRRKAVPSHSARRSRRAGLVEARGELRRRQPGAGAGAQLELRGP